MNRRWLWLSLTVSVLFGLLTLGACSASKKNQFGGVSSSDNGATTTSSASGSGGGCGLNCGSGGGNQGQLLVTPPSAQLSVSGGTIPTQAFKATFNGTDVTANVTWVVEKPDMGAIDTTGTFTPTGKVGGITKVIALYQMQQGSADVTINVSTVVNTANLTQGQQDKFNSPSGPDPSMSLVYPYDKTVMPLRVLSPEFMWNGGGGGDIYRLRLTSKYITYTEFFNGGNSHKLVQQQWENVEFSGTGPISDPLKVELSRMTGGTAYAPKTIDLRIAQGIIYGSIYYWQLPATCGDFGNGHVLRIKPSSEMTDEFFPNQPCYGCHSVSRDGKKMMATYSTGTPFPMQTIDLTKTPAQLSTIQQGQGVSGVFSTWNNDSTKIAYSDNSSSGPGAGESAVHIIDANTGAKILQNAFPPGCGEPSWSPDGTMIAAICGMSGFGWTFDSPTGNLTLGKLNKTQNQITSSQVIVPQGGNPGRPAYPSFTPDSKYIAFGRPTNGSRSTAPGDLWFTDIAGKSPVKLQAASDDDHSYNPIFAPISAGGYTWIVFISQRDYGNQLVGAQRNQLWMTAIDDPPTAGKDPSHPPFYIRGQVQCDYSENAYYALDPCKPDGADCEHGIECCNKSCIYDQGAMKHICKKPDGNMCIPLHSGTCKADADCCDVGNDVICLNGFCEPKPLK